jgi:microsomal dipeptidase-like Zn-dependent dipeptidase
MKLGPGGAVLLVVGAGLLAFYSIVPGRIGRDMNRVVPSSPPYEVSAKALALHEGLRVADLHADTLLWSRDLLARGTWGHVDVPRLREGNVTLQIFTVVTKTPRSMNIAHNDDRTDNIFWLGLAERWPLTSLWSLRERAIYQAGRLREAAERSGGALVLVRTSSDLDRLLSTRKGPGGSVGAVLGIEGAHALDDDLGNLDRLYEAGFRMVGLTHFFDNAFGGSAHGVAQGGLTSNGRALVGMLESRRMIVDVAHASHQTIKDVLAMAHRPVVASHTGVRGTCDNARNLTDDEIKGIAATGGVVGIGYWDTAVCGTDPGAIARAIAYTVAVAGVDHVGLGSDFDGAVTTPFDASGLAQVTEALLRAGLSEEDIKKIMGENALRLLGGALPR